MGLPPVKVHLLQPVIIIGLITDFSQNFEKKIKNISWCYLNVKIYKHACSRYSNHIKINQIEFPENHTNIQKVLTYFKISKQLFTFVVPFGITYSYPIYFGD
jgi:hypothetical protein